MNRQYNGRVHTDAGALVGAAEVGQHAPGAQRARQVLHLFPVRDDLLQQPGIMRAECEEANLRG